MVDPDRKIFSLNPLEIHNGTKVFAQSTGILGSQGTLYLLLVSVDKLYCIDDNSKTKG